MASNAPAPAMKKTLGLTGVTVNAMALIAPGAFLWITLQLQAAQTAQLNQYLLASLRPGSGYSLLAGNAHAEMPEYDLKYFVDSLTKDPQEIGSGPLEPVSTAAITAENPHADHSGILLWGILAIVLVLLASLSYKMMRSIPKENQHDRP